MQSSEHCAYTKRDGEPKSMLATHVDDMLWATKPGYEDRVQQLFRPLYDKDGGIRYVSDSVDEK